MEAALAVRGADSLIIDLEDGVESDKAAARIRASEFLTAAISAHARTSLDTDHYQSRPELLVRLNYNGQDRKAKEWQQEIEETFGAADGYVLPKVHNGDDILRVDNFITGLEFKQTMGPRKTKKVLLPMATETPMGVLTLKQVCQGPRVVAVAWAPEAL